MSEKFEHYHYTPSLAGAIIFAVGFFLSSGFHVVQLTRTKTWYFIPLVVGALMEAVGYIGRAISNRDPFALTPYLIQALFLLIAPALYAASIYMILGRLITTIEAEHHSMIRVNWLTKIFVAGDVLSFLMQSTGGGMMAKEDADSAKRGERIVLGGLLVQILFFGFFMLATVIFDRRLRKSPTQASQMGKEWRTLLIALYVASLFILVRSAFRVIEYVQGREGYLMKKEVWLYIFDAVLMLSVTVLFNVVHPSVAVPGRKRKSAEDGYALRSGDLS
ncbi:RTA1 like protein [Tuber magnatum]|uniref:RTA1 like protein n=1 Tax=Tuber magnatum TaxID=42249 RepID=A0A317SEW5_9PEZI|nr:RTA1 like protein [Tuber magnatum]